MDQARIVANRQAAARRLAEACLASETEEQAMVLDVRLLAMREQAISALARELEAYAVKLVAEMALARRVSQAAQ